MTPLDYRCSRLLDLSLEMLFPLEGGNLWMKYLEHFLVDVLSWWRWEFGRVVLGRFSLHLPVQFFLERFYF